MSNKCVKEWMKKIGLSFIIMMLVFGAGWSELDQGEALKSVYAESWNVGLKNVGAATATQGDTNVIVSIEVVNHHKTPITFDSANLEYKPAGGITISGGVGTTTTIAGGGKTTINFFLDIDKYARTGIRDAVFTMKSGGEVTVESYGTGKISVYEKVASPEKDGYGHYVAALDFDHAISPYGGFEEGDDNKIDFTIRNNGNTYIQNAQVILTLPEGLSVFNASSSQFLGSIATGGKKEVSFPVTVSKNMQSKNYPVDVELKGLDRTDKEVSIKKTFYVPVSGKENDNISDLSIMNIDIPQKGVTEEDFTLGFDVVNTADSKVEDIEIAVEPPEHIINKTKNLFVETKLEKGQSKHYSVTFASDGDAEEKSYPIKITLKSSKTSSSTEESSVVAETVTQYASIFLQKVDHKTKTPQLMVEQYQYGGTYVQAGSKFRLTLGLFNTSTKDLSNIKVSVGSEEGVFVPVENSSSFFIESLEKKGHTSNSIMFSVKPDAEQKTSSLEVNMSYEDGNGNEFTAKDVISLPVMQETRLQVDDIVPPMELYVGMPASASIQFFNKGKTILNNLTVSANGNFDVTESLNYYVGNMEAGKSDTYDFTFTPRQEGPLEGQIIFNYEDASGKEQSYAVPFTFQVMGEMPGMDGDGMGMEPEEVGGKKKHLPLIIGSAIAVLAILTILFVKKHRKKKLQQEMEIDE